MAECKKILTSNQGESLMESIVSILVFSILVAAVTMILTVSMRWTAQSFDEAYHRQNAVNAVAGSTPAPPWLSTVGAGVSFRVYVQGEHGNTHEVTLHRPVYVRSMGGLASAFAPAAVMGGE